MPRDSGASGSRAPTTIAADVSDCRRTEAEWRHDQWWAIVQGVWMPIPRDKELAVKSIDGYAYVCSGWARVIFCFIPPNFGS